MKADRLKASSSSSSKSSGFLKKRLQKAFADTLTRVFMGILLAGMLLSLLIPDRTFSVLENRPLQTVSGADWSSFLDGKAAQKLSKWYADQFFGRDALIHFNYLSAKTFGDKQIKDVYLGHRTLLGVPKKAEENVWRRNLESVRLLAQACDLPVYLMSVPSAAMVQPQKLPAFAPVDYAQGMDEELELLEGAGVQVVDVANMLYEHKTEYLFYNTDHHWTSYGAGLCAQEFFESYQAAQPQSDEEADDTPMMRLSDFQALQVSDDFEGTYASQTGSVGISDDIYIYHKEDAPLYTMKTGDQTTTSIFNRAALEQKDQYELFLGKNQALVQIETNAKGNGKHLLLLKDSFGNSLVQFLLPYYRTITVVDPRYFYGDFDLLMSAYSITDVLCVFSYDSIVTDSSLGDLLDTYGDGLFPKDESAQMDSTAESSSV